MTQDEYDEIAEDVFVDYAEIDLDDAPDYQNDDGEWDETTADEAYADYYNDSYYAYWDE